MAERYITLHPIEEESGVVLGTEQSINTWWHMSENDLRFLYNAFLRGKRTYRLFDDGLKVKIGAKWWWSVMNGKLDQYVTNKELI